MKTKTLWLPALQVWLFTILLKNLKDFFADGTLNFLKVLSVKELINFTKSFTRRQSFVREVRQVHVKKGKRKYTLLFVETLEGTVRFNLGRHREVTHGYLAGRDVLQIVPAAFPPNKYGQ